VRLKHSLLLGFVILSCVLIALIWVVNMTQQGAEAARPIMITPARAGQEATVTPSPPPNTQEPGSRLGPVPTLSDILEDQ
jgi:hypothetical protein